MKLETEYICEETKPTVKNESVYKNTPFVSE